MPEEQRRLTATDVYTSTFHVGDEPQKAALLVEAAPTDEGLPESKRARLAREKAERVAARPLGVPTGYTRDEELLLSGVDPKGLEQVTKAREERLAPKKAEEDAPKDAPKADEPRRLVAAPSGPKS